MIKILIYGLLMWIMAACSYAASDRAEKPAFKGMDLYSWKPDGKDWHFNLLPGTNWLKPDDLIRAPKQAIDGVEELKKRLALLAEGENVFWRNLATEPVPDSLAKELKEFCDGIKVKLTRT